MNNAANLELFSQILLFKNDQSREELVLMQRSNDEQRTLQAIAHSQALVYEYRARDKRARISRPGVEEPSIAPDPEKTASEFLGSTNINDYARVRLRGHEDDIPREISTRIFSEVVTESDTNNGKNTIDNQNRECGPKSVDHSATVAGDRPVVPELPSLEDEFSWQPWDTAPHHPRTTFMERDKAYLDYQSCKFCGFFTNLCICTAEWPPDSASETLYPYRLPLLPLAMSKSDFTGALCFTRDITPTGENDIGVW